MGADTTTLTAIDRDFGENIRQHRTELEAIEEEHTKYRVELGAQQAGINSSLEKLAASGLMSEEEVQVIRTARESRLQDERIKRARQMRERVQVLCQKMQREMTTFAGRETALLNLDHSGLSSQPSETLAPGPAMNPLGDNRFTREGATAQRGYDTQQISPASTSPSNTVIATLAPQENEISTLSIAQDNEYNGAASMVQDSADIPSPMSQDAAVIKLERTSPPEATGGNKTRPTPTKPQHKRVIDSRVEKSRAEKSHIEKLRMENYSTNNMSLQHNSRPVIDLSYQAKTIPPPYWYSRNDARTKTGDGYLQNGLGLTWEGFEALRSVYIAQDVRAQGVIPNPDKEGVSTHALRRAKELRLALLWDRFNLGRIPDKNWVHDALQELYMRELWYPSAFRLGDEKSLQTGRLKRCDDDESINSTEEFRFLGVKFRNNQHDGIRQVNLDDGKRYVLKFKNSFQPYTGGKRLQGVSDFIIRPQYAKEILYHRPGSLLYFTFRDDEPSGNISLSVTLSCTLTLDRLLKECSEGWLVEPRERDTLAFATYR